MVDSDATTLRPQRGKPDAFKAAPPSALAVPDAALLKGLRPDPWGVIKTWAGRLGAVAAIVTIVWTGFVTLADLRADMKIGSDTLTRLEERVSQCEQSRAADERAARLASQKTQEVLTNLRIAVAALEAVGRVRTGQGEYRGHSSLGEVGAGVPDGYRRRAPVTRQEQVGAARRDVREALERARQAQGDIVDPF